MPTGASEPRDDRQVPDYRALLEATPGLCLVLAPDFRVVAVSDDYLRLTRADRDTLVGRRIFDVLPANAIANAAADDAGAAAVPQLRASLDRVLASGRADEMPVQKYDIRRPADQGGGVEERYWRAVNAPVLDGGPTVQFIVHRIEDVTEVVRLRERVRELDRARDEAERASRARDEFLSVVSHELRTPLNVIQGWMWQVKRPGAPEHVRARALEIIERNVTVQARLVEDLLDTSRAAIGKLHLRKRLVDFAQACEAAVEGIERHAQAKGLTVTFDPPDRTLFVLGDGDRLQQVISNLLSNALKFTPPGGSIAVTADRIGTRARVTVRDTGVGVPPEFLPTMFEPFAQADRTMTGQVGGLGLGLAIVKQIVTLHGGTVSATSDGNRGTTIALEFPIPAVLADPEEDARGEDTAPPIERRLDGVKVLVVDDEADACEAVRLVLEQHGATVQTAVSGAEALQVLPKMEPHVLVADLAMPEVDGYDLIRRVRLQADPSELPAVALTAHADTARDAALLAGFQQFTLKPIPPDDLVLLVERLSVRTAH